MVTQVDKDDVADLGLIKTDLLSLATLSVVKEAVELVNETEGISLELDSLVPFDDPAIYEMMCEPDTIGLFQVESRAQIQMLPKMQPREIADIVVEVAIVRPGPIQGKMIHVAHGLMQGPQMLQLPSASGVPCDRSSKMRTQTSADFWQANLREFVGNGIQREPRTYHI